MEYPKAFNCLTRVQFHSNQGRSNDLDERVQGKFLKGSFLGSKIDSFFGDGVGGLLCICGYGVFKSVPAKASVQSHVGR